MIGSIVGNYKITEKIGEGGMGAVYKGVDMMLEREVAIKALKPELGSQPAVVERFRSEAVTLAKLNHPNIATLYNFFRQGDHFFMVLEFVRGGTLDRILHARGAMPCEHAITMFSQVLEGIDHAHRFGVVHRDIKPGNVMITDTGTLKVMDFGIARVLGTSRMTKAGSLIGTVEYMSPEQVRGQETDARSDIYSLGMLLYEMLTGRVPFSSDSEFELMKSQVEAIPPPPRDFAPHIPNSIENAILKSLAKRPEDRFQTAGEFRATLLDAGIATASALDLLAISRTSTSTPSISLSPSSHSSPLTPLSQPSNSQPSVSQPSLSHLVNSQEFAKETRITGSASNYSVSTPPVAASLAKETRFGIATDVAQIPYAADAPHSYASMSPMNAPSDSFINKLNWKHYTAAGFGALLLVVVIAVPVALMFSQSKQQPIEDETPLATQAVNEPTPQPTPESLVTLPDTTQTLESPPADTNTSGLNQSEDETSPVRQNTVATSSAISPPKQTSKTVTAKPVRKVSSPPSNDSARRRAAALNAMDQ